MKIDFLDHLAIRVADIEVSAAWYEKVLELKRYRLPEWGASPIFLLSGKSGVALFPVNTKDIEREPSSKNVKIDHFAFNVTNENFEKAIAKSGKQFSAQGISYNLTIIILNIVCNF